MSGSRADEWATDQRPTCCDECPFARATSKAYLDTRGDNGERFIGQAHLSAVLPCHRESMDNNATPGVQRQCAGAAKFRANIGVAADLNKKIGRLPEDRETVFATEAELLAHHKGWTVERADEHIKRTTIWRMQQIEFDRAVFARLVEISLEGDSK